MTNQKIENELNEVEKMIRKIRNLKERQLGLSKELESYKT